jgi:hypothetical protein
VEECITGAAGRSKPTGVSYDEIHAFSKKSDQGNGSRRCHAYVAAADGGRKGYAAALVAGQWNAAGERRTPKIACGIDVRNGVTDEAIRSVVQIGVYHVLRRAGDTVDRGSASADR